MPDKEPQMPGAPTASLTDLFMNQYHLHHGTQVTFGGYHHMEAAQAIHLLLEELNAEMKDTLSFAIDAGSLAGYSFKIRCTKLDTGNVTLVPATLNAEELSKHGRSSARITLGAPVEGVTSHAIYAKDEIAALDICEQADRKAFARHLAIIVGTEFGSTESGHRKLQTFQAALLNTGLNNFAVR